MIEQNTLSLSQHTEQAEEHQDVGVFHDTLHLMGDYFGYGWLLIFIPIGAFFVFRKKFKGFYTGLFK